MDTKNILKCKPLTESPESYWIDSTSSKTYPPLAEDINVDVAIIGGGIAGITTGYLLKKQGLRIAIIEASRILHGTTGHTTAKITSQHGLIYNKIKKNLGHDMAMQYADANESAIKFIENTINENKIDCDFEMQASYIYTKDEKYAKKIQDEVETASELGINASYLESIPLPFSILSAVKFDNQAQFHPLKYLFSLSQQIPDDKSYIFENTRAIDIKRGTKLSVIAENGSKVNADSVVIASHYPFYNMEGFYFARMYPERSYVLGIKINENYPGGMYISAEDPTRSLRSQKINGSEMILLSGEHHKTGQGPSTMRHYEDLRDFACTTFNVEDILYRWSTQDCMTLDGIPYSGHYKSSTPNIYVATGFGKWGMTNSTASALIIRDLITKGESEYMDVYSPSRTSIAASAKNFVVENANVAKQLISGKLETPQDDVEIKPDEAKVITANGKKTGAYRDKEGILHLCDTTCTHMGCELKWNDAEETWDCPCHGSRFTIDGKIVEGPALKPIKNEIRSQN
jgi:glycine/D-amino acid oxidase-like deaminating enzyme/nitrite reductase/ring-hydroxylating ferredoxin subunit